MEKYTQLLKVDMNLPNKKYKIIYADPPWAYSTKDRLQGCALTYYKTMSIKEICALPIIELTDKDSILFLWATFPQLGGALKVIKAWGFKYKTVGFVWIKMYKKEKTPFMGLGFWTRSNAEVCLLATKGNIERINKGISQLIFSPKEEHSKKPDIVRKKIVELIGDLPRIELFSRHKYEGWDVWGLEAPNQTQLTMNKPILDEEMKKPNKLSKWT